ncbi:unnamed protein product [Orchesella dallaii]|uniref:Uncharacterized protein n=1 Tax=Orchesella dallaii TaxID=48710 RepID=A0ABP1PTE2_9HEXA
MASACIRNTINWTQELQENSNFLLIPVETSLIEMLLKLNSCNVTIRPIDVRRLAFEYCKFISRPMKVKADKGDGEKAARYDWYYGFKKRHESELFPIKSLRCIRPSGGENEEDAHQQQSRVIKTRVRRLTTRKPRGQYSTDINETFESEPVQARRLKRKSMFPSAKQFPKKAKISIPMSLNPPPGAEGTMEKPR